MTIAKTIQHFISHVDMVIAGNKYDLIIECFKKYISGIRTNWYFLNDYQLEKYRVVSTLINAGADIIARNYYLWTPMDCAAAYGQPKCVKILIEVGTQVLSSKMPIKIKWSKS